MAAGPAPSLEEASAIYLMIVHPPRASMVSRGFWKGLGTLVGFPSSFLLGVFYPPLRSSWEIIISVGKPIESVQHEVEGKSQATREEFGRRSARPSIRPLLIYGAFPALGVCGGGKRMQAAFLGAPVQAKYRVSTTSSFQKPWSAQSPSQRPGIDIQPASSPALLPPKRWLRRVQVLLDATGECQIT